MIARIVGSVACAVLLTAACGSSSTEDPGPATRPPTAAATGLDVYLGNCASCHGDDLSGKVGPALGPGSHAATLADDEFRERILVGGNGMPGWDGLIPVEDIDAVIAYLRGVQSGA